MASMLSRVSGATNVFLRERVTLGVFGRVSGGSLSSDGVAGREDMRPPQAATTDADSQDERCEKAGSGVRYTSRRRWKSA